MECKTLCLAPTGNVVEFGDADRSESASRWCADLREVSCGHSAILACGRVRGRRRAFGGIPLISHHKAA